MPEIKIAELVKRYKKITAVDRLNLEIQQGELFALLGINGAGKTTTIKMLSCLTQPSDGDAFICGYSITKEPGIRPLQCNKEKGRQAVRRMAAKGQHSDGAYR